MSDQTDIVRFNAAASIFGCLAGVAIAIGVPWVILTQGQSLGAPAQVTFVWVGIISGAVIAAMSAFFGLVMPSQVGGGHGHAHREHGRPRQDEPPSNAPPTK